MKSLLRKLTIQLFLAVLLVLFGIALIAAGFYVDPRGHIDPTVLTAYGETLTFAGSVLGLDYRYRYKYSNPKDDEDAHSHSANS